MKKRYYTILVALVLLAFTVGGFLLLKDGETDAAVGSVETYAQRALEACRDADYRPTCYEKEIPKYLGELALDDIFEVIRTVKGRDGSYRFCHVLAHELGEQEVAKDPKNWINVIAKGPADGLCSNGFIHGAAVARFSKEVLNDEEIDASVPELNIACEQRDDFNPTPLDQAICYHGMGHVLLHLTGARVDKSLEVCDEIALKDDGRVYTRVCDEGVFMQIFQPLEPEDFALIDQLPEKPTKETLGEFCKKYGRNTAEESACWREGWPFFREELQTPEGIVAFCEDMPNEAQRQNCLETALVIQGRHGLNDPQKLSNLCNALPSSNMQGTCFNMAAKAYVEEDKNASDDAVAFCAYAEDEAVENFCYDHLIQTANFVFGDGSPHLGEMCAAMPETKRSSCEEQLLR